LGAIVEMMSTAQWGKNLKFKDLVLENLWFKISKTTALLFVK
jgi:hypothetical protein